MTQQIPPRLRRLAARLAESLRVAPEAESEWLRYDLRAFLFTLYDEDGDQVVVEFWARCQMRAALPSLAWALREMLESSVTISRGQVSRYTMSGTIATPERDYRFVGFWRQTSECPETQGGEPC